jgi:DNA-binding transcriptional LysR family regulator
MLTMRRINPRNVDLNLLRVFLAIWDSRNLTAAGARLGLTQPAVSHALGRLRLLFEDPLFVRISYTMVPTEAATRLHGPLDEAFALIGHTLQDHSAFDPATARRLFRIAMSDMSEYYVLPPLLAALERTSPNVRLRTMPMPTTAVGAAMRAGEIDLALGYLPGLGDGCVSELIFADRYVCMVRAGHPLGDSPLTRARLSRLHYVYASTDSTGHNTMERLLVERGIHREIVLELTHFTIAPEIVRATDLAVIFPLSIAEQLNRRGEFRLLPLPFELPAIEVSLHSHVRFAHDSGIVWLRQTLLAMFRQ